MSNRLGILLCLLLVVSLAGCLTYASETTVHEDGSLETQGYVEFDELLHAGLEEDASAEGFDSVAAWLADDLEQDGWADVEVRRADDAHHEDVRYEFTTGTTDAADLESIEVSVDGDDLVFVEHQAFQALDGADHSLDETVSMTAVVTLPWPVTETNGDQVDDRTVQWTHADHAGIGTFEVAGERGADTTDTRVAPAVAALALSLGAAVAIVSRRR